MTISCPNSEPMTGPVLSWWAYYHGLHEHERTDQTFTVQAEAPLNSFSGWVYDQTLPSEKSKIIEHTEITLKHTPEP